MEKNDVVLPIAERVVAKLGGAKVVAKMIGRHPSRVQSWSRPRSKGGNGGVVPEHAARRLRHLNPDVIHPRDFWLEGEWM